MCKKCGEPIICDMRHQQQDRVKIWLLRGGVPMQSMEGLYDSYGRVINDDSSEAIEWDGDWDELVDLHYNDVPGDGWAAVHSRCMRSGMAIPTTVSERDPDQGWLIEGEY